VRWHREGNVGARQQRKWNLDGAAIVSLATGSRAPRVVLEHGDATRGWAGLGRWLTAKDWPCIILPVKEVVEPHAVRLLVQSELLPDVTVPRATQGHGYWKWKAAARRHCRDGSLLNKLRTLRPKVFAIPISPLMSYRVCNCQVTYQFINIVILGFFYRPSSEPRKCSSHVLLSSTLVRTK
jgi:hypothetical protein